MEDHQREAVLKQRFSEVCAATLNRLNWPKRIMKVLFLPLIMAVLVSLWIGVAWSWSWRVKADVYLMVISSLLLLVGILVEGYAEKRKTKLFEQWKKQVVDSQ
jgi:hypothetical protein